MTLKDILGLATGTTGLMILGGYVGYKYGNKASIKNQYVGAGAGAAAGYLAAQLLSKVLGGGAAQAQLQAAQAAQAAQQQALKDYVDLDAPEGYTPPPQPLGLPSPQQEAYPQAPQFRSSPANVREAEGSYGGTSYDISELESSVSEAEDLLAAKRRYGGN